MAFRFALCSVVAVAGMDRVMVDGGRCMDGTTAGYYYEAPLSGVSDIWVIHLPGGGACRDEATCKHIIASTPKGSSKTWKSTRVGKGIIANDPGTNPDFYGAHKVHIPYCTQDTYAGTVVNPTDDQWGLYFSGHLNFEFIVEHIISNISAARQAKRILLTGGSAGGAGTITNCDFLQDKVTSLGLSAQVSCAPVGGWFFPGFTEDQEDTELTPSTWENWSVGVSGGLVAPDSPNPHLTYLHPDCAKAHGKVDAWKCASVSVQYPYTKVSMYIVENQYDTNQISAQLGLPLDEYGELHSQEYIGYFGRAMRNSTQQVVAKPGDGLFLPSCADHVGNLQIGIGHTTLQGYNSSQGLGDWFFGRNEVPAILIDDCTMTGPGLPCNPSCMGVPSPSPSPLPLTCTAAVRNFCGDASGKWGCATCAQAHGTELVKAGCTEKIVRGICEKQVGDIVV